MHDVTNMREMLADEIIERREAGYEVDALADGVARALVSGTAEDHLRLLDQLEQTAIIPDWPYVEPSMLTEIQGLLAPVLTLPPLTLSQEVLPTRLLGAWLGRCAGCNLGKPVEGWTRAEIRHYLETANAYPLTDYLPRLNPLPEGYVDWTPDVIPWGGGYTVMNTSWPNTTRGNITFMARDDDTDYTMLGLHILETYGFSFTTEDVAQEWLTRFPFLEVYTAERAAYRNLITGVRSPNTAVVRNPYREWIGAQIRADMWGYVHPGQPRAAATMAFKDAALSHTQNGLYGAMWVAAVIAAAFTAPTMRSALEAGLREIPPHSRLAEAIRGVFALCDQGLDWEAARDAMETRFYGTYSFVHTINNAAVVTAALLWGEGDFTRTIGLAVQGGWDTDCNGATAGSIFGAMHGAQALPDHWVQPLNNRIRSSLSGFDNSQISDLATRTVALARLPSAVH